MSYITDLKFHAVGTVLTSIFRVISVAMAARSLNIEEFGIFISCVAMIEILIPICLIGLPAVISRYTAILYTHEQYKFYVRIYIFWAFLGLIVSIIASFLVSAYILSFSDTRSALIAFWMCCAMMAALSVAYLQGRLQFFQASFSSALGAALTLMYLFLFRNVMSLELAFLGMALGGAMQFVCAKAMRKHFREERSVRAPKELSHADDKFKLAGGGHVAPNSKAMIKYGATVALGSAATLALYSRGETIILALALKASDLAIYGAVVSVMALAWRACSLAQGPAAPHLSKLMAKADQKELSRFIIQTSDWSLAVSISISVLFITVPDMVIQAIFGCGFAGAAEILSIVAPIATLAGLGVVNQTIQFETNGKFQLIVNGIGAVVSISAASILAKLYGVEGAIFSKYTVVFIASCLLIYIFVFYVADRFVSLGILISLTIMVFVIYPCYILLGPFEAFIDFGVLISFTAGTFMAVIKRQ